MDHSEASLKSLKKDEIINLYMKLKSEKNAIENIEQKMDQLYETINGLVSSLNEEKEKVSDLSKKVVSLERSLHSQTQYSRRECLEVVGISKEIENDKLQDKVIEILDKINVKCDNQDIESCHRIKNDRTIVKLSSRRKVFEIMNNKKNLKLLKSEEVDLPSGTRIYINESLCPYYRGLWGRCKGLEKDKKIHSFWTFNGIIRVKKYQSSDPIAITHDVDFFSLLG